MTSSERKGGKYTGKVTEAEQERWRGIHQGEQVELAPTEN